MLKRITCCHSSFMVLVGGISKASSHFQDSIVRACCCCMQNLLQHMCCVQFSCGRVAMDVSGIARPVYWGFCRSLAALHRPYSCVCWWLWLESSTTGLCASFRLAEGWSNCRRQRKNLPNQFYFGELPRHLCRFQLCKVPVCDCACSVVPGTDDSPLTSRC